MNKHWVEFHIDTEDKYNTRWTVYADIEVTKDVYATGDSPTGYEATITSVHNGTYDEDLDILGADTINYLEEEAIDVFVNHGEGYCA
jgi:hypothetical protein